MPEGDTVFRTAATCARPWWGTTLTRCDIRVPRYATVDLSGRVVDEVLSRGKHLFIRVGDASIHSHLKMDGSWRVTRGRQTRAGRPHGPDHPGDRRRPGRRSRSGRARGARPRARPGRGRPPRAGSARRRLGSPARGGEPGRRPGPPRSPPRCWISGCWPGWATCTATSCVSCSAGCPPARSAPARPTPRHDPHARDVVGQPVTDQPQTTGNRRPGEELWVYGRAGRPCRRCGTRSGARSPPTRPGTGLRTGVRRASASRTPGRRRDLRHLLGHQRVEALDRRAVHPDRPEVVGPVQRRTPSVPGRWGRPGRSPRRCPPAAPHRPHA